MTARSLVACYLLGEVHIFLMMKKALPFLFLSVGEILFVLHVEAIVYSCLLLSVHICYCPFMFSIVCSHSLSSFIHICCHCHSLVLSLCMWWAVGLVCVCMVAADDGDSPTIHWCSGLGWCEHLQREKAGSAYVFFVGTSSHPLTREGAACVCICEGCCCC